MRALLGLGSILPNGLERARSTVLIESRMIASSDMGLMRHVRLISGRLQAGGGTRLVPAEKYRILTMFLATRVLTRVCSLVFEHLDEFEEPSGKQCTQDRTSPVDLLSLQPGTIMAFGQPSHPVILREGM